jgi:ferrochelatase
LSVVYLGTPDYSHASPDCTGLLLTNLGTPAAPTATAVRRYLAEFLADPRVIEAPRFLWWLVLHGVILRIRPRRSAALYQKLWNRHGYSPLLETSWQLTSRLQEALEEYNPSFKVTLGMRYGAPSLGEALESLRQSGVRRLLVLPLYPQYSATTTASTFDAITAVLRTWRWLPEVRFVTHYHDDEGYIEALAQSLREHWQTEPPAERLLFSFHGIPKRYFLAGDPYYCECLKTVRLVTEQLALPQERWAVAFQSRVGREQWLTPYTDQLLQEWGRQGIRSVEVLCPGFAVDCLETLEEIALQNRDLFLAAGGQTLRYVPALNDHPEHVRALTQIVLDKTRDWWEGKYLSRAEAGQELAARQERAMLLGARR